MTEAMVATAGISPPLRCGSAWPRSEVHASVRDGIVGGFLVDEI
jgi:hypothetical protein